MALEPISSALGSPFPLSTGFTRLHLSAVPLARRSSGSPFEKVAWQGLPGASNVPFYRAHMGSDTPFDRADGSEARAELPPEGCLSELSDLCPARALGSDSYNSHR